VSQLGEPHRTLFDTRDDYHAFEQAFAESLERCRARAHAFSWLPNAIELVVEVGDAPLGRLMQQVTSRYARFANRRDGEIGHVFARRYQALLFDPQSYLLSAVRYVHHAAVRKGLAAHPTEHVCNSYAAFAGGAQVRWLTTERVLVLARRTQRERRAELLEIVGAPPGPEEATVFSGQARAIRVLGTPEFVRSLPRDLGMYRTTTTLDQVIDSVVLTLGADRTAVLSRSRRRDLTLARAMIAWHAVERRVANLSTVARRLNRDPSSLSVAAARYSEKRPELFELGALNMAGPLLRRIIQ
jgi:REP element-mobilizing transposase RayT